MSETEVLPEIKQIVGAMLFASKGPLAPADIRRCLKQVAEERGGAYRDFAELSETDLLSVIEELRAHLREIRLGVVVNEVAGGFRMENEASCGPWLRALLQKGRANRLSRPALETLAVVAYRQPCTRAEIEAIRGVAVDQILRNLMDMQLVRIVGRSELPGRPWQFGTTQKFLEYFGLKDLSDLPGIEELRRIEAERKAGDGGTPELPLGEPAGESAPPESDNPAGLVTGGATGENAAGASAGDGTAEGKAPSVEDSQTDLAEQSGFTVRQDEQLETEEQRPS